VNTPSKPAFRPTVLIVEDDPAFAEQIERQLRDDGRFLPLPPVSTPRAALSVARQHPPAAVLYDLHLQGRFATDGLGDLRDLLPDATLLVLSHYQDPQHLFDALRFGADGYILKGDAEYPVPDALANTLANGAPLSRDVARRILRHFRAPRAKGPTGELTARQQQVLELVCEGRMDKEIADRLGLSVDRVKQHVAATKKLLHARTRVELVNACQAPRPPHLARSGE